MPAAGLGSPVKCVFFVPACSTLKRAKRITAQAVKKKQKIHSHRVLWNTAKYMMSAGAVPNEMASTSESSSSPKRVPDFVALAMRPSNVSAMAPNTMKRAAASKSPREAATMAKIPKNRFASVKPLGSATAARGRGRRGRSTSVPRGSGRFMRAHQLESDRPTRSRERQA